ncbi:MAG: hypothetical protein GY733_20925 [bacterium]|nr:hypothetical protein [bacterium]
MLVLACLTPACRGAAAELWSRGDVALSLNGSMRQIGLYTHQTDAADYGDAVEADIASAGLNTTCVAAAGFASCPAFGTVGERNVGQGLTRLRLEVDVTLNEWLSAVVVYDNQVQFGVIDTLEAELGSALGSRSFLGAEGRLSEGSHHDWNHQLYRGYVTAEAERFELSVGRQRIAWGVGRLWNPIDRFSALPPLSLQSDVTPGIDGIDGRFNLDGFNYLQFVYAPGRSRHEERWAVRLHGVLWDADLSVMGGMFEQAPTAGIDIARNLWEGALGIEAVFTSPERKVWKIADPAPKKLPDYWQVVVSYDINFDFGTGVYLLAEYLYNGNALGFGESRAGPLLPLFEATSTPPTPALGAIPGPYAANATSDVSGSSRVVTGAEHQLGLQVAYDLTPELRGDFVTLVDMDGGSAAFFPNVSYSPLDSLELTLGVQLFAGPRLSQYGLSEPLVHVLADWFF